MFFGGPTIHLPGILQFHDREAGGDLRIRLFEDGTHLFEGRDGAGNAFIRNLSFCGLRRDFFLCRIRPGIRRGR